MIESLYRAIRRILFKKWNFLAAFLGVFFFTLVALIAVRFAPSSIMLPLEAVVFAPRPASALPAATSTRPVAPRPLFEEGKGELPIGIEIPSVGVKANVENPTSTDVDALDEALFEGAVRYPTSARLGEEGNVLVFGHSSYLPVVHNQSFKAFNEISKLEEGAPIFIYSAGRRYAYAVEKVEPANVANDAIPLRVDGSVLTLVTCNSFGDKSDRFIVTARLVSVVEGQAIE
jgi:LPXTG-site transpeptidase (sortase) family protein